MAIKDNNKPKDTRSDDIPPMESRLFYKEDFSKREPTVVRDSEEETQSQ